jgi:hypothetical protein
VRCWPHQQMPPFVTPRCSLSLARSRSLSLSLSSADASLRDVQVSSLRPFLFFVKTDQKNAQANAEQLKFMKEAEARKEALS